VTTSAPTTTAAAPAQSAPAADPASAALSPLEIDRTYPVATTTRTFVDSTRSTSANGDAPGAPNRTLATSFWYPDAPGTFPLVVFSHGYAVTPAFYEPMLERWAAAGYVVAAPTYPILSGEPGGASHVDYEETFADTSFVISQVLGLGAGDALGARVDGDRIAVTGHSDGEVVAFGVGYFECCRDLRVRSVIAMAGNLENGNNPHVRDTGLPILHVMETGDEYDPYDASIAWDRENLTAPRWMLTLEGATHVPPYQVPGNPHFELLASAVVDFLDGTLKGHPERLDRMAANIAARPDLASLER
jgi:dienelactone hydrolase